MTRSSYHSGCFEGNECTKILNNIKKLEDIIKKTDEELLPFANTISSIKLLDELVNKSDLDENYDDVIATFSENYTILNIKFNVSITNKVHIVMDHLTEYLKEKQTTLKKTTDQTIECTHSKLDKFLKEHGYFRKNDDSSSFGEKICEGLRAWNSYIIGDIQ